MITNKNNSGWILCPSKTFRGKFYYFNVLNGETAWSIGDTEKKMMKKDGGIQKVMGNHQHPEPSSPPTAYNPSDPLNLNQPKFTQMQHPTPVFGQSVFPKALPTKPDPNVIWTPIQIQVPIVLSENRTPNQLNQMRISQVTQMPEITEEKPILEIDEAVMVQSCVKPLCQRFVNYEKPVISFNKDNRIEDKQLFDKFYTSTPMKKPLMSSVPTFKTIASNVNTSFQDIQPKVANQKLIIKKPAFSFEVPSKTPEKVAIAPNIALARSKFNLGFEDLQPKLANEKQIVIKPTFDFEVPSKTPEKVSIAIIEQAQSNTNSTLEDLKPKVANRKSIIKKPAVNVEILSKTLKKVTISPNTEAFQSKMNSSYEHLQPAVANQKPIVNKPFLNVEVPSKSPEKVFKESKKVEPKNYFTDGITKDFPISEKMFNNFDLRMLLVAKKRISQDLLQNTNTGEIESIVQNYKTTKQESTQQTKKRVTFNLDYETADNYFENENESFKEKYAATVEALKALSRPKHQDQWCIVADTQLLLEEFSFLERFVQIDPKCKLLVPSSVYSEVSAVSRGDCRGRTHVNHARNVMRRLGSAHIKVQSADDEGTKSPINDAILKCCVETIDQNIHLILITNNQELLRTAKCYPIPCYDIQDIKNGLAAKPKTLEFKQMKITIPNDTDSKFTQNGLAVHSFRRKLFDETVDLNEKEKAILRKYKQILPNSKSNENSNTNYNTYKNFLITKIANGNLEITNMNPLTLKPNTNQKNTNSKISKAKSLICTESSRIADAIPIAAIANSRNLNTNCMKLNTNSIKLNPNSKISSENYMNPNANSMNPNANYMNPNANSMNPNANSMNPNANSMNPNANSTIDSKMATTVNCLNANKNARTLDENSNIMSNPKANSEWRSASDITETTVGVDIENLNLKENPYNKTPEKVQTTLRSEKKNSNETVSFFFQNPAPKFDFQEIENTLKKPTVSSYFQNGGPSLPFVFGKNTTPVKETSKEKPDFGATNQIKPIFETNKTKEPQTSFIGIKEKSNMAASKVDIDVYKKPESIQLSNRMKKKNDLSMFYVKNKVMENRLKGRMDEWLCTFRQVMEETLSAILENVTSSAMKSTPPWSLLEALKCTRNLYKHHTDVTNIVDELCWFLYDTDCRNDKTKKNLTPHDLIKSIGCGINLIKCLKSILQHSEEIFEAEKCLLNMMNHIEDPTSDINEPLVKMPVVGKSDDKQVRQNFIKNRSEIINYLKKHYTQWKNYDENDAIKTKTVRTVDKDLLKLENKVSTVNKNSEFVDQSDLKKLTVGSATKNVDNATKIPTKTCNTAPKNDANNLTNKTEIDKTKIKLIRVTNAEKLSENCQRNIHQLTKTIDNNCVDLKEVVTAKGTESKTKIIFDLMKPKETTRKYNKESIGDNRQKCNGYKFKIDSQMLGVKIDIPNDYKNVQKEDKNVPKTPENIPSIKNTKEINRSTKHEPKLSTLCIKPTEMKREIHKITNENGPKIIRNINLIKEFEERMKNKKASDIEELDTFSQDTSDGETHIHSQKNDLNDRPDNTKNNLNHSVAANDFDLSSDSDTNLNDYSVTHDHSDHLNENLNAAEDFKEDHALETKIKNEVAAISDRKSYKDDMTYDSGLGDPQMYSIVESFSSELEHSLEYIQRFIDGSIQDFRTRKLSEERKRGFRLRAFEANFLLTKIINGLNKLTQKEVGTGTLNGEDSGAKITSRNTEAIGKCLENAQTLQGVLNMMLSVTEDDFTALNSSMSLNASS